MSRNLSRFSPLGGPSLLRKRESVHTDPAMQQNENQTLKSFRDAPTSIYRSIHVAT